MYLKKLHKTKVEVEYRFHETDIEINTKTSTTFFLIAFIGGLLSGVLGVGGATIYNPVFILMDMHP